LGKRAKRAALAAGALTLTAVTAATGLAASANAAPLATISVSNVSITSMNLVNVKGTLTNPGVLRGDYGFSGSASWVMKPNANVAYGSTWFFWGNRTDTAAFWPGMDSLGTWHAYPLGHATDGNGQTVGQNTATFYIRQGSRLSLSASRSGPYVTLTAHATRYNDRLDYGLRGAWQAWPRHSVAIQVLSGHTWKTVASRATSARGGVSYRVSSPSARSWRAQDAATGTIWGATSGTIRR